MQIAFIFIFFISSNVIAYADTPGWMFRADQYHSGVYDDGGIHPRNITKWTFETERRVFSSPAVVDGTVYIGSGITIYALNATTGKQVWNNTGRSDDSRVTGYIDSSPAVANDIVYAGSYNGYVNAWNATTGALLWSYKTENYVISSPAVGNGIVYIGSWDGKVYALNAVSGQLVWDRIVEFGVTSSPAVANNIVYVCSDGGNIYALNATTGSEIWNYTIGRIGYSIRYSSPAVVDGVVYIGSNDSNVYALDAANGSKIWNYTTGGSVFSSPAVADGILYVGSGDGNVYALDAVNGSKIWSYKAGNYIASSPAITNGTVYIGSYNGNFGNFGNVYAIGTIPVPKSGAMSTPFIGVEGFGAIILGAIFHILSRRND